MNPRNVLLLIPILVILIIILLLLGYLSNQEVTNAINLLSVTVLVIVTSYYAWKVSEQNEILRKQIHEREKEHNFSTFLQLLQYSEMKMTERG